MVKKSRFTRDKVKSYRGQGQPKTRDIGTVPQAGSHQSQIASFLHGFLVSEAGSGAMVQHYSMN